MNKAILSFLFCLVSLSEIFAQSDGDYRSRSNGNWSQANRWQVFYNGAWRNLESNPAGPYEECIAYECLRSYHNYAPGHTISVNASTNANQLSVASGATLRVNANRILTIIDDGTTPLTVDGFITVNNNGTLDLQGLTTSPVQVNGSIQNIGVVSIANSSRLVV